MKVAQEVRVSGHLERTSQRSRTFQMNKRLRGWPILQDRAPYVQRQERVSFCRGGPGAAGDEDGKRGWVPDEGLECISWKLAYVENF